MKDWVRNIGALFIVGMVVVVVVCSNWFRCHLEHVLRSMEEGPYVERKIITSPMGTTSRRAGT